MYENAFIKIFLLIVEIIMIIKKNICSFIYMFWTRITNASKRNQMGQFLLLHTCISTCTRDPSTHRHSERIMGNSMHGAPGDQTQPPRYCNVRLTA